MGVGGEDADLAAAAAAAAGQAAGQDIDTVVALRRELAVTKADLAALTEQVAVLMAARPPTPAPAPAPEHYPQSMVAKLVDERLGRVKDRLVELEKKERIKSAAAAYAKPATGNPEDQKVGQLEQMLIGMLMPTLTGRGQYEGPLAYGDGYAMMNHLNCV